MHEILLLLAFINASVPFALFLEESTAPVDFSAR
jgi:hypothetical protein